MPVHTKQIQSPEDTDQDLWTVLDMCKDEELEELHDTLYGEGLSTAIHLMTEES